MIEVLLGSKTKVKILQILSMYPDGLTRNKIAEYSSLHPNNIYDQIEDLIFFDIITKKRKIYLLNQYHVLYETIKSFFQIITDYSDNFTKELLLFIHTKLDQNYYVTGYYAAKKYITPIDYAEDILQIAILDQNYEYYDKKLSLLTRSENISYQKYKNGMINIFSQPVKEIPSDIRLEKIEDHNIYIASVTRGIIDCFKYPGVSDYGKCLLLIQNEAEKLVDFSLLETELEQGLLPKDLLLVLQNLVFNKIGNFNQIKLTNRRKGESKEVKNAPILQALKEAIDTVSGTY